MDRVISMILNTPSIREVIAFPKNRSAFCPLTRSPSYADESQLFELGLMIKSGAHGDIDRETREKVIELSRDIDKGQERITRDEVYHVAKLARLTLSESEAAQYQKDLNSILTYVESLEKVETEGVAPMSHVLEVKNVWKKDIPSKKDMSDDLLSNAPMIEKGYFKVPKILED